jgi:hypothetical protein
MSDFPVAAANSIQDSALVALELGCRKISTLEGLAILSEQRRAIWTRG